MLRRCSTDVCDVASQEHAHGLGQAKAKTLRSVQMGRPPPGQNKVKAASRKKGTPRAQDDDRPWRTPPRAGRKSPSRSKASSPGRRKSPRRKGASSAGVGGASPTGAGGAAVPYTPASYRDVTAGIASTSSGGLVSHTALARSAGLTRVEAVRQGAPNGPDCLAVDPAAHSITIGNHIAETCATLTEEQLAALRAQRAAIVAEMNLIDSILRDRRVELRLIDETMAGIRPTTPRRRRSSGARQARTNSATPLRSKSPKR
eukprot:COSAG02_NODE_1378_length_12990_cov_3.643705_6_plen_259_part_00